MQFVPTRLVFFCCFFFSLSTSHIKLADNFRYQNFCTPVLYVSFQLVSLTQVYVWHLYCVMSSDTIPRLLLKTPWHVWETAFQPQLSSGCWTESFLRQGHRSAPLFFPKNRTGQIIVLMKKIHLVFYFWKSKQTMTCLISVTFSKSNIVTFWTPHLWL